MSDDILVVDTSEQEAELSKASKMTVIELLNMVKDKNLEIIRTRTALSNFRERCLKAIAELQETLEGVTINEVQAYRINGKIGGIKLALSYFDEMKGETK